MKFNFLNGPDGTASSKRVITFIVLVLIVIYFFANLFWGRILKQTLEDNLLYIFLVSFTGIATEKAINNVAKKIDGTNNNQNKTE